MLVTFSTDNYGDITMFGDIAKQILTVLGQDSIPGAIRAQDVPAALAKLNAAMTTAGASGNNAETPEGEPIIDLRKRLLPLIALFESAVASQSNVMWK